MSDYKGIFASENLGLGRDSRVTNIYEVNVVKRNNTKFSYWSGQVEATSHKGAQQQWRKEYPEVRAKFDHSYALIIKPIVSF